MIVFTIALIYLAIVGCDIDCTLSVFQGLLILRARYEDSRGAYYVAHRLKSA